MEGGEVEELEAAAVERRGQVDDGRGQADDGCGLVEGEALADAS